jgi:DNA (cytosine-5)-methyltransferase 1
MVKEKKYTVISTFAGCGGSSLGYKWAGFTELLAIEWDKNAVETFKLNFPEIPVWQKDIAECKGEEILKFCKIKKGELDVLDGSPPCQGFSTVGKRDVSDSRNDLFKEFVRLIIELNPKVFLMENVTGMIKGKMKGKFFEIMDILKSLDYNVKCKRLNSKWYEVPQSRERLIFIGVRKDIKKESGYPSHATKKLITVKDMISDLLSKPRNEKINHVWFDDEGRKTKNYYLALNCKQGKKFAGQQKRHIWNKPVNTLQTPGGRIIIPGTLRNIGCHPILTRTFSIREYARLSSFPDSFKLSNHLCFGYKQIGNAVMPKFMYHLAKHIKENILN